MRLHMMKLMSSVSSVYSVICLSVFMASLNVYAAPLKPRIVVLTDISLSEPDDHQSLTRLLVHADLWDLEGILLTTGWSDCHPENPHLCGCAA